MAKEKIEIVVANDDTRIEKVDQVLPPIALLEKYPASEHAAALVKQTRYEAHNIIHGKDDRLLVIIGPCSIHDPKAAIEYANRLKPLRDKYKDSLEIIMRVYFVDFLPSELHWLDVLMVLVAALALSLIASLYPASRAAKLQPAQVLSSH